MQKKAFTKNLILFLTLTFSLVIFCGSLFSYAAESVPALGMFESDVSLNYLYNGNPSSSRLDMVSDELSLPYDSSLDDGYYWIQYDYSDVYPDASTSDVVLTGVDFYFYVYDVKFNSREHFNFKLDYKYQPGRVFKLTIGEMSDAYVIFYTSDDLKQSFSVDFNDLIINDHSLTKPNAASYEYVLDFDYTVPNNKTIYGFDIYCPFIELEQSLLTTSNYSMMFGLQSAELFLYNDDESNQNNVNQAEKEANRLDDDLDNISDSLEVETPSSDDLLDQADPFAIVDLRDFESFADVFSFIKENGLLTGMISLIFIFVLFKYVLFGKG